MKKSIDKIKLFIVITLSVLLVGMVLVGVLGFNGSVDNPNKNVNGYEVQVSVDQNAGDSYDILKTATEEFFANNSLKPVSANTQSINKGRALIYKFDSDVTEKVAGLADYVTGKLVAAELTTVTVDAEVYQVYAKGFSGVWWFVLAAGVAVVVICLYQLVMEKVAGALATVFSSVLAAVLFVALMGITRLPAAPFIAIGITASAVIGAALSASTVNRYKEESSIYNVSAKELTEKIAVTERKKYVLLMIAVALLGIALIAFGLPYLMTAGAQLIVAGLAGTYSAYFGSAVIWSAIKR